MGMWAQKFLIQGNFLESDFPYRASPGSGKAGRLKISTFEMPPRNRVDFLFVSSFVICMSTDDETEREAAVAELCVRKCADMNAAQSLRNHKTGWNALKNLCEPHKSNLKRMGYSIRRYFSRHTSDF